jgi:hypothetical protein
MNSYLRIFQSIVHLAESYITENRIETSVSKLLCLTSDLNTWTSNFVVHHGDQSIDVSSAAFFIFFFTIWRIPKPNYAISLCKVLF